MKNDKQMRTKKLWCQIATIFSLIFHFRPCLSSLCQLMFCSFTSCSVFVLVGLWREVGNVPVSVAHNAIVFHKATPSLNALAHKIENSPLTQINTCR